MQPVRQGEDRLAAGVEEAVLAEAGPERIGEDVATVGQQVVALDEILRNRVEVVGPPVRPVHGVVPFEDAVVAGDAAADEPEPGDALLLNVQLRIDAELAFQLREVCRHLEQIVIQRRPRGVGDEPVEPDQGHARGRVDKHGPGDGGVVQHAVGIVGEESVPEIRVPEIIAQVDAEDQSRRIDGLRHADARMPGEAVEQLGERVPIRGQLIGTGAGIGEGHEAEVTAEAASSRLSCFSRSARITSKTADSARCGFSTVLVPAGAPASIHCFSSAMSAGVGRGCSPTGGIFPPATRL